MAKDQESTIYRRFRTIGARETVANDGKISLVASTDKPISWGGWNEVLSHQDGAIDMAAARSLLVNHDPDMLAGGISGFRLDAGTLICDAQIDADARMRSDISVQKAVAAGYLHGVSIGYCYERADCVYIEATNTVMVRKWRLLEISLTPVPADDLAHVRSLPTGIPSAAPAAPHNQERSAMSDQNNAAGSPAAAPNDEAKRAQEIAALREQAAASANEATIAKREAKLRAHATEHGVSVEGLDFAAIKSDEAGLLELLQRKAKKEETTAKLPVVTVTRDGTDKWIEAIQDGLTGKRGGLFQSNEQIMRKCLEADGERTDEMAIQDLANLCLRRMEFRGKRSANKTTSSFSVLVGSTANKQLLAGFDDYSAIYTEIATIKDAKDYNIHPHVGVSTGRLLETPEGQAMQELFQKEGSYNSQLKMYGATLSITEQTLVNDTLGEILRSFYKTGFYAGRTIDRMVMYRILNATWTYDLTTSAALATAGNFDKTRAAFKGKLAPSGEKMEMDPAILLVDPTNRYAADIVTGQLYGITQGAGNSMVGSNAARSVKVVDSTFVGDTGLYSSALTSDYYLFGNPKMVDTVTVEFLGGQRVPQIQPFDAGAVAAVAMKVQLPFEATMATHTDSADHARNTGIQKAQA